ncbi:hypothetical protein ACFU5O_15600 [Streptomyces sp. NPDC057445]|uniref:hypothetical protein n=1 Tax=Streptomyces sp. NPDC057445 TaxID=3346136 RepID=UPI0036C8A1E3
MPAEGTWHLTIDTPLGKQQARVLLAARPNGTWHGTAEDLRSGEQVPLTGITVQGDAVTYQQSITKPMRLHLSFRLTLEGDRLTGQAKAGRLPGSRVTGRRVTGPEAQSGLQP